MPSDPRVFFASERTLLAWLRTGIAIVGLGFLVSRFGLFLHLLGAQATNAAPAAHDHSHAVGVLLVVLGAVCIVVATVQHGRFIATLPPGDRPTAYSRHVALWLASVVAVACLALAGYLALLPQPG
jgi:putative membrane protein